MFSDNKMFTWRSMMNLFNELIVSEASAEDPLFIENMKQRNLQIF